MVIKKSTGSNVIEFGSSLKEVIKIYFLENESSKTHHQGGNGIVCNIVTPNKGRNLT